MKQAYRSRQANGYDFFNRLTVCAGKLRAERYGGLATTTSKPRATRPNSASALDRFIAVAECGTPSFIASDSRASDNAVGSMSMPYRLWRRIAGPISRSSRTEG